MEMNTGNFAHNQISLILNKVYLTKKMCHVWPFRQVKFACPGNFDAMFLFM